MIRVCRRISVSFQLTTIDYSLFIAYSFVVIKTFKNKELANLWVGKRSRIGAQFHTRILIRLDTLNDALEIEELSKPGYSFHALNGFDPTRYTIHVNGPWCITFEFWDGNAYRLDFEQYH